MLDVKCECGQSYTTDESHLGETSQCLHCGKTIIIEKKEDAAPVLTPVVNQQMSAVVKEISFLPAVLLNVFCCLIGVVIGLVSLTSRREANTLTLLALPVIIFATVLWAIMHYRAWKTLPVTYRFTTPGRAVGFCFIPFFNIYWEFVTSYKLAVGLFKWQTAKGLSKIDDIRITGFIFGGISAFTMAFIYVSIMCAVAGRHAEWVADIITTALNIIYIPPFVLFYVYVVGGFNKMIAMNRATFTESQKEQ